MAKEVVKIADLAQLSRTVDISEEQSIQVRALNLREMVKLFVESQEVFLPLYALSLEGQTSSAEAFGPFLLSAPAVVAKIIAMASDEPDKAEIIEQRMPATVQLIALAEIWEASVPDKKKASQLLSEVTKLLQGLSEKGELLAQQKISPTTLQPQ